MESAHKSKQKCLCKVQMLHQNWSMREESPQLQPHMALHMHMHKSCLKRFEQHWFDVFKQQQMQTFIIQTHTYWPAIVENKTRSLSERCRLSSISHRYLLNSWLRPQLQISLEGWKKTNDHPAAVHRNISPLWGFHFFSLTFFCYLLEKLHFWKPLLPEKRWKHDTDTSADPYNLRKIV